MHKYVGNDLNILNVAQIQLYQKRLYYVGNDQRTRHGAYICDKDRIYVGNALSTSETSKICGKCLNSLTNGLNLWEMTLKFGK